MLEFGYGRLDNETWGIPADLHTLLSGVNVVREKCMNLREKKHKYFSYICD